MGLLAVLIYISIGLLLVHGSDLEEGSHYTNSWMVEFHVDLKHDEVTAIAHDHGFVNYGKIFEDANIYEFRHPRVSKRSTEHSYAYAQLLEGHTHVSSLEQQVGKVRAKRSHIPEPTVSVKDPMWHQTWYLNRGINSNKFDMNVIPAWNKGYTGKNAVVTILDDGIEHDHPDLAENYSPEASTDINDNDNDPEPRYDYSNENRHGTRCAGEVAAVANNSHCSVGVAYDAKIGGIRMLDGSVTDVVESKSLSFHRNVVDVYSSSWGPDDNGRTVDGPGKLAKKAFVDGVEMGRNGKGSIFMWASGNGGSHYDSCACDGYTNSIYTLSVSSASDKNLPPWYLEQCASTIATTYSSGANGGRDKQIVTTDLRKMCTSTHTGTSASAPLAAGLVAVMLEANPSLTWRDVQYVTLAAANPEPLLARGEFQTNGVGRKYSHKFGYGLMDCAKMADIALTWRTAPPQLIKHLPKVSPDKNLNSKYTATVNVAPCKKGDMGCIRHLEHVQLALTMSSTRRGQLTVKLTSPKGTKSTVLPVRRSDSAAAGFAAWPFLSVHFWGEDPAGKWKFEIENGNQPGKIASYQLILYGVAVDAFDKNRPETPNEIHCHETCNNTDTHTLGCFGSGADQCKKCRKDLLKVEDTNMCVPSCEDGYYTDAARHQCNQCYKLCKTCTGSEADKCTSCGDTLLLDNEGHCVEECPKGYFPDEEVNLCKPCKENCTSCTSFDDCLVCGDGFDVFKGKCKLKCIDREYRSKTGECTVCEDPSCAVCTEADSCAACDPQYKLYHKECVQHCLPSTYVVRSGRDSGQTECLDCDEACETCNEGRDNNCLSCHEGYQLSSSHMCVSNKTCPVGQFRQFNIGVCQECHESCDTCHGPTDWDCSACRNNTYLKDGVCVVDCGPGLYKFIDERDNHASCQHCHPSCSECTGADPKSCTACSDTANLEEGVCHPVCPNGKYVKGSMPESELTTSSSENTSCHDCPQSCLTCSGPRVADCNSCTSDKSLSQAGECVDECDNGYFRKGISMEGVEDHFMCHACNANCLTCDGDSSSDCLSCTSDLMLFHNQCVAKANCYTNQFYNSTANECLSCHTSCVDCTGPSEIECTSCGENQALYVPPVHRTTNSPVPIGQCIMCCKGSVIDPGLCCDCTKKGSPKCDLDEGLVNTSEAYVKGSRVDHKKFIIVAICAVFSAIVLYVVIFMLLQYRSHGRCTFQTSSSTILIDGGGVVEYSSLTDKDVDMPFGNEHDMETPPKYPFNNSNKMFDYGSD